MGHVIAVSSSVRMFTEFGNKPLKLSIDEGVHLDRFLSLFGSVARNEEGVYIVDRAHKSALLEFVDQVLDSESD